MTRTPSRVYPISVSDKEHIIPSSRENSKTKEFVADYVKDPANQYLKPEEAFAQWFERRYGAPPIQQSELYEAWRAGLLLHQECHQALQKDVNNLLHRAADLLRHWEHPGIDVNWLKERKQWFIDSGMNEK